jgi:hypothetical protein
MWMIILLYLFCSLMATCVILAACHISGKIQRSTEARAEVTGMDLSAAQAQQAAGQATNLHWST